MLVNWEIASQTQKYRADDKLQYYKRIFTSRDDLHSFLRTLLMGESDKYFHVFLSPGDYRLNETLHIKTGRLSLEGNHARMFGNIKIEADEVIIRNLIVDAIKKGGNAIEIDGDYCEIENCRINGGDYGIYFQGDYCKIKDNLLTACEEYGIYGKDGDYNMVCLNSFSGITECIYFAASLDNSIIDDIICGDGNIRFRAANNIDCQAVIGNIITY